MRTFDSFMAGTYGAGLYPIIYCYPRHLHAAHSYLVLNHLFRSLTLKLFCKSKSVYAVLLPG